MTMDINQDTGRITFSYEHLMGKAQPAHQGSQSSAPDKEDSSLGERYGSQGFNSQKD